MRSLRSIGLYDNESAAPPADPPKIHGRASCHRDAFSARHTPLNLEVPRLTGSRPGHLLPSFTRSRGTTRRRPSLSPVFSFTHLCRLERPPAPPQLSTPPSALFIVR